MQAIWYMVNTLRLSTTEEYAVFKRSKTSAVMRAAVPIAGFATSGLSKGLRALANQFDGPVEDKISDLESNLSKFDLEQLVDRVRSIDPIGEARSFASSNTRALEAEIEDLRAQLAEAVAPKKKGLGGWWWLIAFLTCGLGLFIAAAWWLYGSDDDDLFDEFDDFILLDTDGDLPNAREAAEKAKENAARLVDEVESDDTVDLS